MVFLWVILYGLVYAAAAACDASRALPLGMVFYTAAFLRWTVKSGYAQQMELTGKVLPSGKLLPLLLPALGNFLLGGCVFPGLGQGLVLICVCITEELFFRGFLFRYLLKKGVKKAVLGTSLLFSVMHLANLLSGAELVYTMAQLLFSFWTGVCYCLVILGWGSMLPGIGAHVLINLTASGGIPEKLMIPVSVVYTALSVLYSLWLYLHLPSRKKELVP